MGYATMRALAIGLLVGLVDPAVGGGASGQAQAAAHPAHVHAGTCEDFDSNPRFPLSDATTGTAGADAEGAESAIPVDMSVTTLDVKLTSLLGESYVIDAHESAGEAEPPIACGAIGGAPTEAGLALGLAEAGASGYVGVAWLRADDDRTTVTMFLVQAATGAVREAAGSQATEARVTFYVETVTCTGCQLRVEASIKKAPGILDVAWAGKQVAVTYDPSQVSPEQMLAAIKEGGDTAYEVTQEEPEEEE